MIHYAIQGYYIMKIDIYHHPYIISHVSYKFLYNILSDMQYNDTSMYVPLFTFIIYLKNQIQNFLLKTIIKLIG